MCLIVLAWRPGHAQPLLVAANRDEFYARPSQPLAEWPDRPGLIAGRDLQAGGTWLGVGPGGRFAALTNIRAPGQALGSRSRGELPLAFLSGQSSIETFLQDLHEQRHHYREYKWNSVAKQHRYYHRCYDRNKRPNYCWYVSEQFDQRSHRNNYWNRKPNRQFFANSYWYARPDKHSQLKHRYGYHY